MKELNIIITAQCENIVPAVYGGAVETLITMLLEENEKQGLCKFIIFCSYDAQAEKLSKKYKKAEFIFITQRLLWRIYYKLKRFMIAGFLSSNVGLTTDYYRQIWAYIKRKKGHRNIDAFVLQEGEQVNGIKDFVKIFGVKTFYHSHLCEIPKYGSIWPNVIFVSEFCKKEWLSVPSKVQNALVVPNGISLKNFVKQITDKEWHSIRHRVGLETKDIVLIYVGRIVPKKGVQELLQSLQLINNKNVKLLIVGSSNFAKGRTTSYVKKCLELAKRMSERVIFTGYISNDELYKYYKIADIQVIPSIGKEAAGLVAIEGMASGLPLVVTNSGGLVDYVDSKCAVIVDKTNNVAENLAKGISTLREDSVLRKNMGAYGRERVKLFSQENYYQNFIKAIHQ